MSKEQSLPAHVREQIEREYPYSNRHEGYEEYIKRNASIRGAEIAMENQWVRVEDRPPETAIEVLVTDGLKTDKGIYLPFFKTWTVLGSDVDEKNITHWQPLPKSPKQ